MKNFMMRTEAWETQHTASDINATDATIVRFVFTHDAACCTKLMVFCADAGMREPPDASLQRRRRARGAASPRRAVPHSSGDGLQTRRHASTTIEGRASAGCGFAQRTVPASLVQPFQLSSSACFSSCPR